MLCRSFNHRTYILEGKNPVCCEDRYKWEKFIGNISYRRVAESILPNGGTISTVFLGFDHRYCDEDGPPILFETMIFSNDEHNEKMWRYSTWDEAIEGHKKAREECLG